MLSFFMRQKHHTSDSLRIRELEEKLERPWDLSRQGFAAQYGLGEGVLKIFDLIFRKLNHTVTAILKSVVVLASLGPALFRMSKTLNTQTRDQNEMANEISNAGIRIAKGIEAVSDRTQTLTGDFTAIEAEVTLALEKGDLSMAGFGRIKAHVGTLVETIQVLKENSQSIGAVIDVINNISDETNILSLNARIEAARGQADGKGFKVIAEEVGHLARQSKESTRDIQDRLTLLTEKIARTVEAVERVQDYVKTCEGQINEANTALNQVCSRFGGLSESLDEINGAAVKQTEDVRRVSTHIMEIESALGEQVQDAEKLHAMADQINGACDQMVLDAGVFHLAGHGRARQVAETMARDLKVASADRGIREKALEHYLETNRFVELAYLTDAKGRQVTANIYSPAIKNRENLEQGFGREWSAKEWFKVPAESGDTFISKVYRSSATHFFCFTVAVPLRDESGFSGVLGIDINFKDMLDI